MLQGVCLILLSRHPPVFYRDSSFCSARQGGSPNLAVAGLTIIFSFDSLGFSEMDNYKSSDQMSLPHEKLNDFLFFPKILLSQGDFNEVNLIDSGLSHKLYFPPV
jgi:hypothetical protein